MRTSDLAELLGVLEFVRAELKPQLDPVFVRAVAEAESRHLTSEAEAQRALEAAVREALGRGSA